MEGGNLDWPFKWRGGLLDYKTERGETRRIEGGGLLVAQMGKYQSRMKERRLEKKSGEEKRWKKTRYKQGDFMCQDTNIEELLLIVKLGGEKCGKKKLFAT